MRDSQQNLDHQICRFLMQIGLVNFPSSKEGFMNKSCDGKCTKKLNEEEFPKKMYLDFVDDL